MNVPSHRAAFAAALDRTALLVALSLSGVACKTTPQTNPFATPQTAEPAASENAAHETASTEQSAPPAANSNPPTTMAPTTLAEQGEELSRLGTGAALAAVGLGKEIETAARDAVSHVRQAAATTVATQKSEAERVAAHVVATADQAAGDAQRMATEAQQLAVEGAYEALHNASADVRREACNTLAEHADPRHVQALLAAMNDPQAAVRLAAIRALGAMGTLEDPRPLVELLDAPDKVQRVEAALALVRLRVDRGAAALDRLSLDTDAEIRQRAARAMGEIPDPRFLPALVAMLGDQAEVRLAAMASLERIAGSDAAAPQSAAQAGAMSDEERARRWQQWYAQQPSAGVRR